MKMVAYEEEEIRTVIKALNAMKIEGIENAKLLTYAASTLQEKGHPADLEEKQDIPEKEEK